MVMDVKVSAKQVVLGNITFWKGYWIIKNDAGNCIRKTIDIIRKTCYDAELDAIKNATSFAEQNQITLKPIANTI
jgi:hypothetical protein